MVRGALIEGSQGGTERGTVIGDRLWGACLLRVSENTRAGSESWSLCLSLTCRSWRPAVLPDRLKKNRFGESDSRPKTFFMYSSSGADVASHLPPIDDNQRYLEGPSVPRGRFQEDHGYRLHEAAWHPPARRRRVRRPASIPYLLIPLILPLWPILDLSPVWLGPRSNLPSASEDVCNLKRIKDFSQDFSGGIINRTPSIGGLQWT